MKIANCRNETFERLLSTCAPSGSRIQVSKSQNPSYILQFAFFNFQFLTLPQTQALLYFLVDELKYYCYYRRRLDKWVGPAWLAAHPSGFGFAELTEALADA